MNCALDLLKINLLNKCKYNISGIQKLWIAPFSSKFYPSLKIENNEVVDIGYPVSFQELDVDKTVSQYQADYDFNIKQYVHNLIFEHLRFDWKKRDEIDKLLKSKIIVIIQNSNGEYFMLGEQFGLSPVKFSMGTNVVGNTKNAYHFEYQFKSDNQPLGFDDEIFKKTVDCSEIWYVDVTISNLYLESYYYCLVGDLPSFIEP